MVSKALNSLFTSFLKSRGGENVEIPGIEADVLEFVSGDFVVMVLPHPTAEDLCVIEIQIRGLALEP